MVFDNRLVRESQERRCALTDRIYAGATLVAIDRVNDRAHFPSDVVAGAAIGVAVGRFIVDRHENPLETPARKSP